MISVAYVRATYEAGLRLIIRLGILSVLLLAAGSSPESLSYQTAMAHAYALQQTEQYRAALDAYRVARSMRPHSMAAHLGEAQTNLRLGRWADALAIYRQIFDQKGASPQVLSGWGQAYYELGDSEKAVSLWQQAAQQGDPTAHFYLARLYLDQSNWPQARKHLEEALRLSNEGLSNDTQSIHYWLGMVHTLDAPDLALAYLKRAEQGADENLRFNARAIASVFPIPATLTETLSTRLGIALFSLGHQELAQAHLKQALQTNPNEIEALIYLGAIMTQNRSLQTAEPYLQKALQLAPEHPMALFFWGKYQLQRGETLSARQTFAHLLAIDPQNAAACAEIARAYRMESKYALAEQWLEAAIENAPTRAEFYIALAEFEASSCFDLDKGLEAAIQSIAIAPDNPMALDLLGQLLYLNGQWAESESALREAVNRAPEIISPYYHLGELYAKQSKMPQARWAFGRAVDLGRDNPLQRLAEQALRRLGSGPEAPP